MIHWPLTVLICAAIVAGVLVFAIAGMIALSVFDGGARLIRSFRATLRYRMIP